MELIRRLHEHRQWATRRLVAAAEALPSQRLHQTFEIGQGTIWRSLLHMYAAEFVWLATLLGDESPLTPGDVRGQLPGNQAGEGAIESLGELQTRWRELDERWNQYLATLEPTALDEVVYKVNSLTGRRTGTPRSDILLHVCTHAHWTTSQAINMLRQAGAPALPDVMLITLAREA